MNQWFILPARAHDVDGALHDDSPAHAAIATTPIPEISYVSFGPTATAITYVLLGLIVVIGLAALIFVHSHGGKE